MISKVSVFPEVKNISRSSRVKILLSCKQTINFDPYEECVFFPSRLIEEVKEKCDISLEAEDVYMNTG